jgi:hypothetical protein
LLDQVHILLRRGDAFLRFLLEGMQHINVGADLDGHHGAVSFAVMPEGDLEDAAANPLLRLGILGHPAILHKLELAADEPPCVGRERLNISPRVSQPYDRAPDWRYEFLLLIRLRWSALP